MIDEGEGGSVTRWIGPLKAGDAEAARALWSRDYEPLVRVARRRIQRQGGASVEADEEDAALSAFAGFCAALARDRYPDLGGRDDLWRLLVVIAARKVARQAERQRTQKRGGGRTRKFVPGAPH